MIVKARVPAAVQHERTTNAWRNLWSRGRSWCTAEPGPPWVGTVPGLQRTAAAVLCNIPNASAALRCAPDTGFKLAWKW